MADPPHNRTAKEKYYEVKRRNIEIKVTNNLLGYLVIDLVLLILQHIISAGAIIQVAVFDDFDHVIGGFALRRIGTKACTQLWNGLTAKARKIRIQHQADQRTNFLTEMPLK